MDSTNSTPGIEKLEDINFWLSINENTSISDKPFNKGKSRYRLTPEQETRLVNQSVEDGYFESPILIDRDETEKLRKIITNLHRHKVMPVFLTVYDEFWEFIYRLRHVITPILGENCRVLPDFWAWYLAPGDDSAGWKPHRDAQPVKGLLRADGRPKMCTVWIPLMDVEASNSCIYVLPRKYDEEFKRMINSSSTDPAGANIQKFPIDTRNLTRIRALPVREGAFIGWDATVFHWGSGSSKWAAEPRISIGIYMESDDMPLHNMPFDETGIQHINLDDPECSMPFNTRLTIIANILETYIYKFNKGTEKDEFLSDAVRQFHYNWKWPR